MTRASDHRRLAAALLDAADWFNDGLLAALEQMGWPALTRHESQVFPMLAADGVSQVEIGRRLGITRQSVNTIVHRLIAEDLLLQVPDAKDGRSKRVVLTDRGRRLADDASSVLDRMEAELAERIGAARLDALRESVGLDWGQPPSH